MKTCLLLLVTLSLACCTNTVPGKGDKTGNQGDTDDGVELKGLDVSHWQGEIDWSKVRQSGIRFAFVKATQGRDSIDPMFKSNWAALAEGSLLRGAYHFLVPDVDGAEQARHFLKTVNFGTGDLLPVVDVETAGTGLPKVLADFLAEVRKELSVDPIIYVSPYFWNDNIAPTLTAPLPNALWIAEYGVKTPRSTSRIGPWTIWQYSQSGKVPGIQGKVDLDRAKTLEGLRIQ